MKTLYFDMDGTIADLYNVDGWLKDLRDFKTRPYKEAQPIYDMEQLNELLYRFKEEGYDIEVITWAAKECDEEYLKAIHNTKADWLNKYGFPYDRMHTINYGVSKSSRARKRGILIDDNKLVRQEWSKGDTIDATKNIIEELKKYLQG